MTSALLFLTELYWARTETDKLNNEQWTRNKWKIQQTPERKRNTSRKTLQILRVEEGGCLSRPDWALTDKTHTWIALQVQMGHFRPWLGNAMPKQMRYPRVMRTHVQVSHLKFRRMIHHNRHACTIWLQSRSALYTSIFLTSGYCFCKSSQFEVGHVHQEKHCDGSVVHVRLFVCHSLGQWKSRSANSYSQHTQNSTSQRLHFET